MQKILIPIKRVPDHQIKVKISADGKDIQRDGVKWIVNPFDEIAVEEAIRIREGGAEVEIVIVCIGPKEASEQIRTALAMGADRGIHIISNDFVDSHVAHLVLAELFSRDSYHLVIMGKQGIDSDANQTGQLLAAKLALGQATFASKVVIDADWTKATVTREVDGGLETIEISLPGVITTDLRLNEPRYPSLPNIVKAKKKPVEEIAIADLNVDIKPRIEILSMQLPASRKAGIKVGSVAELVDKLKNEAKVI